MDNLFDFMDNTSKHPVINRQEITNTKNTIPTLLITFVIIKPPFLSNIE